MSLPVSRRGDQPVVRRNEWDVLTPPAVGAWTPTRTVTVSSRAIGGWMRTGGAISMTVMVPSASARPLLMR